MLLHHRVEQEGAIGGHGPLVPLTLPQVDSNATLVDKRLLYPEGALGQERVREVGHLGRRNGTEIILDAVWAARFASPAAGKHPPQRENVANILKGTD